jgi:transposase-like protein
VPRPGFPKSLREFQSKFATEEACQQYLAACRWPDGFVCPRCGNRRAYELANLRRWQCGGCRYQVSLTAGRILHNRKTPLTVWFWAAYLMTTDKRGLSALLLQRQLGLSRYETAWMMRHKFRRAMINLKREPCEAMWKLMIRGWRYWWRYPSRLAGQSATQGSQGGAGGGGRREAGANPTGRARMAVIPEFRKETLLGFLHDNLAPGSTVYTDGRKSFTGLKEAGFQPVPRSQPLPSDLTRFLPRKWDVWRQGVRWDRWQILYWRGRLPRWSRKWHTLRRGRWLRRHSVRNRLRTTSSGRGRACASLLGTSSSRRIFKAASGVVGCAVVQDGLDLLDSGFRITIERFS